MENTLERGLCPYGGLISISKLGRLSCTSSFAFGYQLKVQVSRWLSTQRKHPASRKWGSASPIPTQTHPPCGHSLGRVWVLFPSPWLLCEVGSWKGKEKPARDSWLLAVPLSLHSAQEMWGHLWVSLISPDIGKIQPQPWVGPAEFSCDSENYVRKQGEEKGETAQTSARFCPSSGLLLCWSGLEQGSDICLEKVPRSVPPTPPSTNQSWLSVWMWCWNLVLKYEICSITFCHSQNENRPSTSSSHNFPWKLSSSLTEGWKTLRDL